MRNAVLPVLLALGLSCFTAGEVEAGPYYDLTMGTSSATLRMVGKIAVGRSTLTANTAEIQIGPGGGIHASSFTATYGVSAATANFSSTVTAGGVAANIVAVGADLSAVYGIRAATGVFSTGVTVGTLSVTGASDFKTLSVSSQNATVMLEATRYGVINSTTQPAARWLRTSALSTADSANVALSFPSREYNTQSLFDVSSATVPVGAAGIYYVGCSAEFANDSDGRRAVWAAKNGTVITGCKTMAPAVAADVTIVNAGCVPYLAEGDVITCNTFHSAGNALNVNSASFEVVKLW